jgi:hypothetical protein
VENIGPKREEATGEWRKLYNGELYDLYCSPDIIRLIRSRRMRWVLRVACMVERKVAYVVMVGRPVRKRPLGKPKPRWEDNIEKDLQEVGWGGMDWIGVSQDRDRFGALTNTVINLWVP